MRGLPEVSKTVSILDPLRQVHRHIQGADGKGTNLPDSRSAIAQELLFYRTGLPADPPGGSMLSFDDRLARVTVLSSVRGSERTLALARQMEAKAREMGLRVEVTGKNVMFCSLNRDVVTSFLRSLTIAVLLISAIVAVALRSFKLGLLALLPNVLPILIGGAAQRLMGRDVETSAVVTASVLLGIAVDDTIHFLAVITLTAALAADAFLLPALLLLTERRKAGHAARDGARRRAAA
jgi:predicted RND superfamily exporter protein